MRTWKLPPTAPLSLHLAADARLTTPDYANDQIWELGFRGGNPAAIDLTTTYGLRAKDMRLFLALAWPNGALVIDPEEFAAPPLIEQFYPNYVRVRAKPLPGIEVTQEFWAPDSRSIAGRVTLSNLSGNPAEVFVQLNGVLRPSSGGSALRPTRDGATHLLQGQTANLYPVVILEPGIAEEESSWPALSTIVKFNPVESRQLRWVHVAASSTAESLERAYDLLARDWRVELQTVADLNFGWVNVETGNPDWDATLAMAQKVTLGAFVGPTPHLPYPAPVGTRTSDHGYSLAGDGSDYDWQWNGQTAFDALLILPQVALADGQLAKAALMNYLAVQRDDGFIDGKPGLGGQRNNSLAAPLLATTAWELYLLDEDSAFLSDVYDGLAQFVNLWFESRYDGDEDSLPEWRHTLQSGYDDNPAFARWHAWAQGADINLVESPDLASYLFRECRALAHIAQLLDAPSDAEYWAQRVAQIQESVQAMWDANVGTFRPIDRDSHVSQVGLEFGSGPGELTLEVLRHFDQPQRVLVRVQAGQDSPPPIEVAIYGVGARGRRVEVLSGRDFSWYWGLGTATSQKQYIEIERIEVRGISDEVQTWVGTVDLQRENLSLLLPLWAGLTDDAQRAALINTLQDPARYACASGLTLCAKTDPAYQPDNLNGSGGVWPFYPLLLVQGLAESGAAPVAAEVLTKLLNTATHHLKIEGAFREGTHADEPEGLGNRDFTNAAALLFPFLQVVGVRVVSGQRVWLRGSSPFAEPVSIKHRGVTVVRAANETTVTFASGRQVTVPNPTGDLWLDDDLAA